MAVAQRIRRLLIANRGEIAVRIARTCRELGITSIAVYSDADARALHVRSCDEAVRIGPAPARESYLDIARVIAAAHAAHADAVHPGYGFLSENAAFAQACIDAGLIFVGPTPAAMRAVGDKVAAKRAAEDVGVPTVPGYLGDDQRIEALEHHACRIGAPLMIKAAAGGGGKGMRRIADLAQLRDAIESAKREAAAAFGDDTVFIEKYVESPRHVEVQILADHRGQRIHLGERDCSIQRRHQKIIEESPSPAVSPELRARLGDAALRIAQAVDYTNAGTVEFMLDHSGQFYFLEVNARLQVEHPVTEAVTGVDLVREQIAIAAGEPLALSQEDVHPRGHALEVRLYAEDPDAGFLPQSGRILAFDAPSGPGLRVDAGIAAGSDVTSDYDPMLAKLIASGRTREEGLKRLRAALDETHVAGITTNVPFLRWLVAHPAFARGDVATDFLEQHRWQPKQRAASAWRQAQFAAAGAAHALGGFRHSAQPRMVRFAEPARSGVHVTYDWRTAAWRATLAASKGAPAMIRTRGRNNTFELEIAEKPLTFRAWCLGDRIELALGEPPERYVLTLDALEDVAHAGAHAHGQPGAGAAIAPMTGTIVKVMAKAGDAVAAHQTLVLMEAMKMEHAITAPYDGHVSKVLAKPGDRIAAGSVLVEIEPA